MRIYHDNTNQLIICYRLVHTEQMIQSFPVPRTLAQQWHIPEKELFLTTGQNAETFFPPALFDMGKFLSCYNNPDRHTGQKTEAENIIRETRPLPPALYILTRRKKFAFITVSENFSSIILRFQRMSFCFCCQKRISSTVCGDFI